MYASFKSVLRGNFFVPKCLYQGCRNKTQINQEIKKKKKRTEIYSQTERGMRLKIIAERKKDKNRKK